MTKPYRPAFVETAIQVGIHIFLWLAVLGVMIIWVPRFQKTLADFKLKVPWATEVILSVSEWIVQFWFLLSPLLLILFLILDAPVYFLMRLRYPSKSWLWSGLMTLLPLAVLSIIFAALLLPQLKVLEGLSK